MHSYKVYCREILRPLSKWNPVWNPGWKPHSWKMLICMLKTCFVNQIFGYICCHAWILSSETFFQMIDVQLNKYGLHAGKEWDWPWHGNDFQVACISHLVVHVLSVQAPPAHSNCNKKLYVEKNRKFMKNSGLFLNMANVLFWSAFWGFNGFVVRCLCVW